MPYDAGYAVIIREYWPNLKVKHIKWDDGEEHFYNELGQRHRLDGPAVIYGSNLLPDEFWLNGTKLNSLEEVIIKNILE